LFWEPAVADYTEAFRARNRARNVRFKVAVIAGLGAVVAVVAFIIGQPGPGIAGVEVAVGLPLATPLVSWLSTRIVWLRRPALHVPTRAVVHPAGGITTDGPLVDMAGGIAVGTLPGGLPWHGVRLVLETRRVFVVQLAGKRFLLLAKRGLADPAELDALRRTLLGSPGRQA
jgi:hypothetical protein